LNVSPYYSAFGAGANVTLVNAISLVVVSPFSVTVNLNTALTSLTIITIFLSESKVTGLAEPPTFL